MTKHSFPTRMEGLLMYKNYNLTRRKKGTNGLWYRKTWLSDFDFYIN